MDPDRVRDQVEQRGAPAIGDAKGLSHRLVMGSIGTLVVVLALSAASPKAVAAGERGQWWLFQNRAYYEPLRAEPRSANVRVTFPAISDAFPFGQSSGRRLVWDISMGKEIPVIGFETAKSRTGSLAPGHWGLGAWLPIGFHMIEDLRDPSGPILNVDYRFNGALKFQRVRANGNSIGIRVVPIGHESTHIGDEFTIAARRLFPEFDRVNVSYEFWEIGLSYEWVADSDAQHHLHTTARVGTTGLWHASDGYYSTDTSETRGRIIARSNRPLEPYLGLECWPDEPFILSSWGLFTSLDVRQRAIYDYRKVRATQVEDAQWSFNLLIGLRSVEERFNEKGRPEFAIRYYYGVNPAGQFRSQRNYTLIGVLIQVAV